MTEPYVVSLAALEELLITSCQRVNVPADHAQRIAAVLLDCELRGHDDHGVSAIGAVVSMVSRGTFNPTPQVRIVRETKTSVLLDGDRGCGVIASTEAMERCIAKAREHGFASAAVRNSTHAIAAGPYALMAAEAGMIGFACSNCNPAMAPTGGMTALFGTNPFAYAVPAGRHVPFLLDISSSATAMAKVAQAARQGRQLPLGFIEDAQGRPTTDPQDVVKHGGRVLPMARHKGYGLAMVVDVLAGVLTGSGFGQGAKLQQGDGWGQFFWVLDVEEYLPRDEFLARMDAQLEQVKAATPKEGVDEVFYPGERGQRRKRQCLAEGTVPLSTPTWQALEKHCTSAGIDLPDVAAHA